MQYDYERFTPDRFQEFCQSLIVSSYPHTQCYPVGQKDGGRDALSLTDKSIVFQVKFKRDRFKNDDPYKLITSAVKGEIEKVKKLAERGAERYIIATNISATSALDVGSMDRVQKYLDDELPIPAQVWWRSDIDSRLNNAYDIKWQFSEIITSSDLLRYLVEEGIGESAQRRYLAVSGYMTAQYQSDEYVKFKQADLQASDLLALFIDVPIAHKRFLRPDNSDKRLTQVIRDVIQDEISSNPEFSPANISVGGASLLLHSSAQDKLRRVVIEGAPGQGKSTLAQYVCQTYRMKFLDKKARLEQLPAKHRLVPVRLPMKVDLRDLSSWLRGEDPVTGAEIKTGTTLSLESFLAAQVHVASGGQAFSVDDLNLFLTKTPTIIFLDGLDEVASIPERKTVVDAVSLASARLAIVAPSTQIVVTSRPAAVANMPRFDVEDWDYLTLESISSELIYEYTERWSAARKLAQTDVDDIKRVLRVKLDSTHVKDLARNAMQLTILLNLVHVRGQALPDHRTALYDSYVDVFFNREADKNKAVLANRQLLIDLHGFLAWTMHSAAENRQTNGRVTEERLRSLIQAFLSYHEYEPQVLDDLWAGVIQRIVALVSRVEGTFEFEVQPLREYFAARHLYNTAPYSPVGLPQSGTKPEIFATIAPSPYWLNVTRFYAGCYSVGELAGLADQVEEMVDPTADGARGSFPRAVATSFLSDRVFSQAPRLTKKVATTIVDGLTVRYALQARFNSSSSVDLRLPKDCGADIVSSVLMDRAYNLTSPAGRGEAGITWTWTLPEEVRFERWHERQPALSKDSLELRRWIEVGSHGRILNRISDADANSIAQTSEFAWLSLVAAGHRRATADSDSELRAAHATADGKLESIVNIEANQLMRAMRIFDSGFIMLGTELVPMPEMETVSAGSLQNHQLKAMVADVSRLVSELRVSLHRRRKIERVNIEATWVDVISSYERTLGRTWLSWVVSTLAFSAGGEPDSTSTSSTSSTEFDDTKSTIELIQLAKTKRTDKRWWKNTFSSSGGSLQARAISLLFLAYTTPAALHANLQHLDEAVANLEDYQFTALLRHVTQLNPKQLSRAQSMNILDESRSSRLLALLYSRLHKTTQIDLSQRFRDLDLENSPGIADLLISELVERSVPAADHGQWSSNVAEIGRLYRHCRGSLAGNTIGGTPPTGKMPESIADQILEQADLYPVGLISRADQTVTDIQARKIKSVGTTARKNEWAANVSMQ